MKVYGTDMAHMREAAAAIGELLSIEDGREFVARLDSHDVDVRVDENAPWHAYYDRADRKLVLSPAALDNDPNELAALIAHEGTHALWAHEGWRELAAARPLADNAERLVNETIAGTVQARLGAQLGVVQSTKFDRNTHSPLEFFDFLVTKSSYPTLYKYDVGNETAAQRAEVVRLLDDATTGLADPIAARPEAKSDKQRTGFDFLRYPAFLL